MATIRKTKRRRELLADEQRAAENLRAIWKAKKKALGYNSQDDLVQQCPEGWNQSTVSNHMRGEYPISLNAVRVYTELLQINDPTEISSNAIREILKDLGESFAPSIDSSDFIMVPLSYDDRVSGGPGAANDGESDYKSIAFHKSFAESINVSQNMLRAVRVVGDSMADVIRDGDVVVGRTDRLHKPVSGRVYALQLGGHDYIKRIYIDAKSGVITLNSDNPIKGDGFPVILTADRAGELILKAEIFHRAGYVS